MATPTELHRKGLRETFSLELRPMGATFLADGLVDPT